LKSSSRIPPSSKTDSRTFVGNNTAATEFVNPDIPLDGTILALSAIRHEAAQVIAGFGKLDNGMGKGFGFGHVRAPGKEEFPGLGAVSVGQPRADGE